MSVPNTTTTIAARVEAPGESPPEAPSRVARYGRIVALAVLAGAALRLTLALRDEALTNDATVYLRTGRNLLEGRGLTREDGRAEVHFPPLTSILDGAAWKLVGDPARAVALVTMATGTLAILPIAALARRLAGDPAAIAAAWFAALTPGLAAVPALVGGGSESPYVLFAMVALWLAAGLPDRQGRARVLAAAGSGVAAGCAYLTRPEALVTFLFVAVLLVVGGGPVGDLRRREVSGRRLLRQLGPATVMVVTMAALALPYLAYLNHHTGRWQLTAKSRDASIASWRAVAEDDRAARDQLRFSVDEQGRATIRQQRPLGSLVREDPGGYVGILGVNGQQLRRQWVDPISTAIPVIPRWALLPLPLLALAGLGAWRHRRTDTAHLLLAVGGLAVVAALGFFVQPRYLVVAVGPACVFAGAGLAALPGPWRRIGIGLAAATLVLPLLIELPRPEGSLQPDDPVENRSAGEWLAANTPDEATVMTRSRVTVFYAGRRLVDLPSGSLEATVRYAAGKGVDYLVADEVQLERFRPQLRALFRPGPWPGLRLVHTIREDDRQTRIFRVVPQVN